MTAGSGNKALNCERAYLMTIPSQAEHALRCQAFGVLRDLATGCFLSLLSTALHLARRAVTFQPSYVSRPGADTSVQNAFPCLSPVSFLTQDSLHPASSEELSEMPQPPPGPRQ